MGIVFRNLNSFLNGHVTTSSTIKFNFLFILYNCVNLYKVDINRIMGYIYLKDNQTAYTRMLEIDVHGILEIIFIIYNKNIKILK